METILKKAAKIKLAIFDVDGVLTDGRMHFTDTGMELKTFYALDGLGLQLLQRSGVIVAIISGGRSPAIEHRATALGIQHLYLGSTNKLPPFYELIAKVNVTPEQTAYTGDDLPDLPVMQRVGLSIAVANAHPLVSNEADWKTKAYGGRGAVREICDLIMTAQNTLHPIDHDHS